MDTLTAKYIEDHRNMIHNYESFGRVIAELMLRSGTKQLEENPNLNNGGALAFTANITITPVTPQECIFIEICAPLVGCTSLHVSN